MTTTPEAARAALSAAHLRMLPAEIADHALSLAEALASADNALAVTVDTMSRTRDLAEALRAAVAFIGEALLNAARAGEAGNAVAAGEHLALAMRAATAMNTASPFPPVEPYAPLAVVWPAAFSPTQEAGTLH